MGDPLEGGEKGGPTDESCDLPHGIHCEISDMWTFFVHGVP